MFSRLPPEGIFSIYVTVPHACLVPVSKDPDCDVRALELGTYLNRILSSSKSPFLRSSLHVTQTERRLFCDNNRSSCTSEPMRRELSYALRHSNGPSLVLDVHSFHDPSSFDLGPEEDWELILLVYDPSVFSRRLDAELRKQGFRVLPLKAASNNDILVEAYRLEIPALILEFSEFLSSEQEHALIEAVARIVESTAKRSKFIL